MPTFSRQDLYELVWTDAVKTVAQSLGISDVWLRKCCIASDIPVPDRGYWTKLRAGKPVVQPKLPPRGPGMPDRFQIGPEVRLPYWPPDPEAELALPPPVDQVFPEPIEEVAGRVTKAAGKVRPYRDLTEPHPLIRRLLEDDEKRRLKPDTASYRLRWSDPLFDSPFERRRLKLLNSIFLGLAKLGAKPWISDEDARQIGVRVGIQDLSFKLDHPSAKADRDGRFRTRAGRTDTLRIELPFVEEAWIDTDDAKLEDRLTEIVVKLVVAGEIGLRKSAKWNFEQSCKRRQDMANLLEVRRVEAIRLEQERLVKAEAARRRLLLRMARDLRQAEEIRALVDAVVVKRGSRLSEGAAVARWAEWALAVADRTDPIERMAFETIDDLESRQSD